MAKARRARESHTNETGWFSKLSPMKQDLVCLVFLYLVTLGLFRGIVFNNASFSGEGDTAAALAYMTAGDHIKATESVDPLWMPYFFSGMPTFGNVAYVPHNISYLQVAVVSTMKLLFLNATMSWMVVHYLLGGIFMFLLMRVWKFSRLAALFAALTFMLNPYGIGLAAEGHGSKLQALSYLPLTFLLTHLLLERRDLLSFGLFVAGIGTLLLTNHMQIVYYVLMVIGLYLLYQIVLDMKGDKLVAAKKIALFAGGIFLGLCISSYIYLSVYEYTQFSIRGGGTEGATGGLTWDYATNWSFHPAELFNFLIPSFFGFSSNYVYNWQGEMRGLPLYWGTMPFTTSTQYVGILPILLSAIALMYRRNKMTLFFALLTLVLFLVSFGKHFALIYNLLFNYLPFFNKFRVPVMILHLLPFTTGILGAFGLTAVLEAHDGASSINAEKLRKTLLYILGTVWAVLVFGFVFNSGLYSFLSGFMFERADQNYGPQIIAEFKKIRFEILWDDYTKFALFTTASLGAVFLYLNKRLKENIFSMAILGILLLDLVVMDSKFIHPTPLNAAKEQFQPDATITYLKQQPGLFRVYPLGDLFMDKAYAYHGLQSIGGYHPAKLKIYQTMLDSCLYRGPNPAFPINMNVVNMLNAEYLVAPGGLPPQQFELVNADQQKKIYTYKNAGALPRAFFVSNAVVATTDHDVFNALNAADFNPAKTAIVEKNLPEQITSPDTARAVVAEFKSHKIVINTAASSRALMVLSEVYYPAGWNAYIDGNKAEIFKTNYVLRSVIVPAGEHKVEFRFEPVMYDLGWKLSNAAWGISILCILAGLWQSPLVRKRLGGGDTTLEKA